MNKEMIGGSIGVILSATGTASQTNEILQVVSLVITIIGALITYVLIPLITWYKKSKQDGKITAEELKEGAEALKEGIDKVTGAIPEKRNKE